MSNIKLYLDEDSTSRSLILGLESRNIDVLSAFQAKTLGYSDKEQLIFAREQNRVIYSANIKDFYNLHSLFLREGKSHTGMILIQQQRYSIGEIIRSILKLRASKSAEEMINQVEFLSHWIES